MSRYKVITDAQGKMSTTHVIENNVAQTLNETRKQLRDMIAGNVQFHKDELSQPKSSNQNSTGENWIPWSWSCHSPIPNYLKVRLVNGKEHDHVPDWCWTGAFPPADHWVVAYCEVRV